ncbi:MAG: hypothetical protein SGPRY_010756, partial [Prymnesium sp.]
MEGRPRGLDPSRPEGRNGWGEGGHLGAMRRPVSRRTIDHLSPGVQLLKDRVLRPELPTCWTPGARRCLSGSADGKFTLWNGSSFNFETTQTGHEGGIRSLCWSHSQEWMLSADTEGIVKYWQPNLSNVKEVVCHKDNPVRE